MRLLNVIFNIGTVLTDWRGVCKVPLYKGKGYTYDRSNSRGISL